LHYLTFIMLGCSSFTFWKVRISIPSFSFGKVVGKMRARVFKNSQLRVPVVS
jgi:hypothetical protein